MMKKIVILLIVLMMISVGLLSGCNEETTPKNGDTKLISVEPIGGTYNVSILHLQNYFDGKWYDGTEIKYTKNGREHQGCYIPNMKETLDWIKTNTSENCTILSWWDYGIMIEGYAERNVIARFGSLAIADTIAIFGSFDEEGKKKFIEEHEWTSNETIEELAMVLTSTNISSDETRVIIQKYSVSYIFTIDYDKKIFNIFLNAAGKNSDEYITDGIYNEKCNETLIFKMWNDIPDISGLELIYEHPLADGRMARIFKLVNFLFGASPMGKWNKYDQRYADKLKHAGINFSYIIASWKSIEPEPGVFEWGAIDQYQNISEQLKNGFKLMGGLALWWYRGSGLNDQFCPTYLDALNFEELKIITYNHMYELAKKYKDKINIWEFNEQNSLWTNPFNLTWREKLEICKAATDGIKDANPEAKILYDSNALPEEFGLPSSVNIDEKANGVQFPEFLRMLEKYGILFDIIGLEFYYSGKNNDGYIPPLLSINDLSELIDLYSSFNKPIFIRELSAPSKQIEGVPMWDGPWNEETQAKYLEQVYRMAFSKALVKAIVWSYGVSDEDSYIISGGILDENLNPKLAYFKLKEVITELITK